MTAVLTLMLLVGLWMTPINMLSNVSPRAETQQGVYVGIQTAVNGTLINFWYGIPYAEQPVGNFRWKPPQALAAANRTTDAYIPNVCPQKDSFVAVKTESCLSLNVYAPANANNIPVYVWIHGGSFTSGAGILYDPRPLISTSVNHSVPIVVVTINYRLGLLGFLADKELYNERSGMNNRSTTGNYGILDQMMALDWIKQNIAGFGGNPNQITIGGESAGGMSVTILLTSPLVANGTFQRAIIESGAIWSSNTNTLDKAINDTGAVLRQMSTCTTVSCLRNLNIDQIFKVQEFIASKSIFGSAASPVLDNYILNDTLENVYAKGRFQRVPILVGSNTNETSLFTCPIFKNQANISEVLAFFNMVYNSTIVSRIPSIYGPIETYEKPLSYLNIVYSDSWLHCGSRRIVSRFSSVGVPSYLYTYNHRIPDPSSCLGVAHAAELAMLFPSLLPFLFPLHHFSLLEQDLSTQMMLYWANFIATSNPNGNGNLIKWDTYTSSTDGDFVFDLTSTMRNKYYNLSCSFFWDQYAVTNAAFN